MNLLQGFYDGSYPIEYCAREELDRVDHLLSPTILTIFARMSLTEQVVEAAYSRCTDDAAWAAELRRRRLVEGGKA